MKTLFRIQLTVKYLDEGMYNYFDYNGVEPHTFKQKII